MLWADRENPVMCAVTHLFAFLALSVIKSGYIFPSQTELKRILASNDSESRDHVSYDSYLHRFTSITSKLIKRPGPFGTHSNRKTAYLFAVWGSPPEKDIMVELMASARHKDIISAAKYKKESVFLLQVARQNNQDVSLVIPQWKSVFTGDIQMGRTINQPSVEFQRELHVLASNFIFKYCGYSKTHPNHGCQTLIAAALDYKHALTGKGIYFNAF
jgi:hypothetical protein